VEQVVELFAHKDGDILITIDEVHGLVQQADNLYKEENNYEEYDEFNAKEHLQQLINFCRQSSW
jgi:hypothetical protein